METSETTTNELRPAIEHEHASAEITEAFNAGYSQGRADGAQYGLNPACDAPDRSTRRRQWLAERAHQEPEKVLQYLSQPDASGCILLMAWGIAAFQGVSARSAVHKAEELVREVHRRYGPVQL
jgi:hypothetical protein